MTGKGTIQIELEGLTPQQLEKCREIIDTLFIQNVFFMNNGSAELFFDDECLLQQIKFRKKRRRREGESLKIYNVRNGTAVTQYDKDGTLQQIEYETTWKRSRPELPLQKSYDSAIIHVINN